MTHYLHAIVVDKAGNSPVLQTLATRSPAPDQLRVKVQACALNFADLLIAEGKYQDIPGFPVTLGMEISGEVLEVGTGVKRFKSGDQIIGFAGQGGLASEAVLHEARCLHRPAHMDPITGAAFQIAYGTSHLALTRAARLSQGERLVVLGAGGGVGLTAVEIGALLGAEVTAVARGAGKLNAAQKAGAHRLIDTETCTDLHDALLKDGRTDVVYDPVGGALGDAAMRSLGPEGRHLLIGFASGDLPTLKPNHMMVKNISAIGFYWGAYLKFQPKVLTDSLKTLAEWHGQGKIKPHVSHVLPMDQALS